MTPPDTGHVLRIPRRNRRIPRLDSQRPRATSEAISETLVALPNRFSVGICRQWTRPACLAIAPHERHKHGIEIPPGV